jgi:hypothetical protein
VKPSALRVLDCLRAKGTQGATTHDLCQPEVGGIRFGARLMELRKAGYEITSQRESKGSHRYTLVSEPAPPERVASDAAPENLFDLPHRPANAIHGDEAA